MSRGEGGGRPTLYKKEYDEQVYKLCLLGATDKEIAAFFDIEESTLNNWKEMYSKFMESIKSGKEDADANVANRLYQRAMGYKHTEDVIMQYQGQPVVVPTMKYYPPDTTAAIYWLKNRRRKADANWNVSDKQEIDATTRIIVGIEEE